MRLRIFDPSGALVMTLVDGRREAGPHRVTWNGCDDVGRRLPSGAYFFQLEAEGISEAKQMLMLK